MSASIKWVAELARVREVSLLGTADLGYWRDRLSAEGFVPAESDDGRAQILIMAADAKFMGIRFRELSFTVLINRPGGDDGERAAYLTRAFNSSRFMAFSERAFFATPYYHGDVRVSTARPAFVHLAQKGEGVFRAAMRGVGPGPSREPVRRGEEGWDGPVFLPELKPGKRGQGKLFFARVRGQTDAYPFLPDDDLLTIEPGSESRVLGLLRDSNFVGREWAVREDATHAKSKTYKRDV